ncbi:tripartite transporter, partial [Kiloniella litopenaei]
DLSFFGALPSRIYGNAMTNEILIAVPLFVFMGVMLEKSKVAEELLDTMGQLFGSVRGGLGISVTIVGALLAASTGIVGATVVTMGLLSLPTMLRRGYDPSLACGSICAAGTLGQIIPPSIVLVILGDQISNAYSDAQRAIGNWSPDPVSVGDLFAGALIPGLMLVGMYIAYQMIVAIIRPESSPPIPRDENHIEPGAFL